MTSFRIAVTPWAAMKVKCTIEIAGEHTLADLHSAIVRAFGFQDEHAHAFFMNGHFWDEEFGVWSLSERGQRKTHEVTLGALGLGLNRRFVYLFDYGDEQRFDVRVVSVSEEAGPERAVVLKAVGESLAELEGTDSCEGHVPDPAYADLVERLEPLVAVWEAGDEDEGEDEEDDDEEEDELRLEDPEQLRQEYALATELLDRTLGDADAIHVNVVHATEVDVYGWLLVLPERLAGAELAEQAVELANRVLMMEDVDALRRALPRYLARAGRADEARRCIERNLIEFPEDPEALFDAGLAWLELEELANAERCWRHALELAGTNRPLREDIMEMMFELLETTGGDTERFLKEEDAKMEALLTRFRATRAPTKQVVRPEPKVGRNDPCPCRSGRKYKKCCGAPDAATRR